MEEDAAARRVRVQRVAGDCLVLALTVTVTLAEEQVGRASTGVCTCAMRQGRCAAGERAAMVTSSKQYGRCARAARRESAG